MSTPNAAIAESYLHAIRAKDPDRALFAPDVTLQYPLSARTLTGAVEVREFMLATMPAVDDIEIERRLTDGDYVVILWQAHTVWGLIPICSVFRIAGGLIQEIRGFFDPRPIAPLH
jgi:limonene-1,2-epoxide hydrolase